MRFDRQTPHHQPHRHGARAQGLKGLMMTMALATAALAAGPAGAQPMMHGGPMDGAPGFGGPGLFAPRAVDHMLDGLNASDTQRSQIKQIVQAAASDLRAQHDAAQGLRDKAMQIFAAPNVDAGAAESVRQQMLQQHDQASRRMLQAMLDVSKVLTPEQRAKLGERMKQRADTMRERRQRMEREQPAR